VYRTAIALGIMLTLAATARAATNSWTSTSSGNWTDGGNWSARVAPSVSDFADFITNGTSKTATINFITSGSFPSTMTISNLILSGPLGSTNTLFLNSSGLVTPLDILNGFTVNTNGMVVVTNSVVRVDYLSGGSFTIDGGIVVCDNGYLITTNNPATVGNSGAGQMTLSNGTWLAQGIYVGSHSGSQGALNIDGGTNTLSSLLELGVYTGSTGAVWVTSGQLTVTNNAIYIGDFGVGQMTVSNGSVLANGLVLADSSTLTLAGGTTAISNFFVAGNSANTTGTVWMTGGELILTNSETVVGGSGVGFMTVSNGTWSAYEVYVGSSAGSDGTLTIAGGTNTLSSFLSVGLPPGATGTVWVTGGQLAIATPMSIGDGGGVGCMTVSNGTWEANYVTVGAEPGSQGTLTLAGGTTSLSSQFVVGSGTNSTGNVWLTGGAFNVTQNQTWVGDQGSGAVTISNGTWKADDVYVGHNSSSQGTLTIAGGTISLSEFLSVGRYWNATGTVWLTGGTLIVTNDATSIGDGGTIGGGVGQMTVSNGTWLTQDAYVGTWIGTPGSAPLGNGTLTMAGGTNTFLQDLSAAQRLNTTGTIWITGGQVTAKESTIVGNFGAGQMTLSNGAWQTAGVYVGYNSVAQGTLTIAGGTVSSSASFEVGVLGGATGVVWITGGQLNVAGSSIIVGDLGFGQVTMSNGTVTVNSLMVNGDANRFVLDGGVLNSAGATISNGIMFADGDGVDAATYHLLGGVHSFANGLRVRNNAVLSGCGTISGTVVVDPGGLVQADCGGTLTFSGSVTNNGTMRAINGSVLEAYGIVVNNGTIDVINGGTSFHGGFVNNGTVWSASSVQASQASVSGQDFVVQVPSVTNHTYQLEYTASLTPTNWIDTGASQPGTGGVLTFTDPGGATNLPARFYRVDCTAP
jgi:hypothetical protein